MDLHRLKNLQQAAREIFAEPLGLSRTPDEAEEDAGHAEASKRVAPEKGVETDGMEQRTAAKRETTILTESTRILGNIVTNSDIAIAGEVQGDVQSENTVMVTGTVRGDIACRNGEIKGASIEGNINALENLLVTQGSVIAGNLTANNCKMDGKVRGNVSIKDGIQVGRTSCLVGEIKASSISVESGAVIQGNLSIGRDES